MNQRHRQPPPAAVRIPADVERDDRVLVGLTARQLLILTGVAAGLYAAWLAVREQIPAAGFAAAALPVAAATITVALGRRDGISLDRWLVAALGQRLSPRHRIDTPQAPAGLPDWIAAQLAATTGTSQRHLTHPQPSTSHTGAGLPAREVGEAGVVDLDGDGAAIIGAVSPVDFALRSPAEQEMLVGTFGRYLHAIGGPVQILIRTSRVDLSGRIDRLHTQADHLRTALGEAAREHADFLTRLGARSDLWSRQLLLVLREPEVGDGESARRAASIRLVRRLDEAAGLLAPAGITITPLDADQTATVLAHASNPASMLPTGAGLAPPGEVITAPPAAPGATDTTHANGWGWPS